MIDIDFYFSVGSRYSYLASTRLPLLETATGCRFVWRPVHNPRLLQRRGRDPFEGEGRSILHEEGFRRQDVARWASLYGVPYHEPAGRLELDSDLLARAATAGARLDFAAPLGRALFELVFVEVRDRIDREALVKAAARAGLARAPFERELDDPATAGAVDEAVEEALDRGVPGVPSFFVGSELFFGNDRLPLLRHALEQGVSGDGAGI